LPCAGALALYDPDGSRWAGSGGKVAGALVTVNSLVLGPWLEALSPVRDKLTGPMAAIFQDRERPETARSLATDILAVYVADNPDLLAELLLAAEPNAYRTLFPIAERHKARTVALFQAEIDKHAASSRDDPSLDPTGKKPDPALAGPIEAAGGNRPASMSTALTSPDIPPATASVQQPKPASEQAKENLAERQARAAVALVRLGHALAVWPLLRHSPDPRLRSFIINWLKPLGVDSEVVAAELDRLDSLPSSHAASSTSRTDAILFDRETSIRRALILALGTYGPDALSPGAREPWIARLLDRFENDPDAGIHGALEWTLRQWKQHERLKTATAALARQKDKRPRRWFVNGQGQTFAVIDGPVEFRMGSPLDEPDRLDRETPHRRVVPRRFAIAAKEVTVEDYQRFGRENPNFASPPNYENSFSPEPDSPMNGVSWFGAAAYCNWLSKEEGLPKDQWCYLPNE
jgi:hypothetical protein